MRVDQSVYISLYGMSASIESGNNFILNWALWKYLNSVQHHTHYAYCFLFKGYLKYQST